jgi:hypothetical protein
MGYLAKILSDTSQCNDGRELRVGHRIGMLIEAIIGREEVYIKERDLLSPCRYEEPPNLNQA